jgi:hypothetical protein
MSEYYLRYLKTTGVYGGATDNITDPDWGYTQIPTPPDDRDFFDQFWRWDGTQWIPITAEEHNNELTEYYNGKK